MCAGRCPVHRSNSHTAALQKALEGFEASLPTLQRWGRLVAELAGTDSKILALGNGGSAAQAQHLTAEFVGRYCLDRSPISAFSLHADTSSLTAIANDFGVQDLFSRQIRAHAKPGDLVIALSTSGRSSNVVAAVREATNLGVLTLALTGPGPNALLDTADESIAVYADETATIQEVHLVAIHILCAAVDEALGVAP